MATEGMNRDEALAELKRRIAELPAVDSFDVILRVDDLLQDLDGDLGRALSPEVPPPCHCGRISPIAVVHTTVVKIVVLPPEKGKS